MLVLTRNTGESIRIGDDIEISVAEVRGGSVRLSIKAPRDVRIYREEVYQRVALAETVAAQVTADAFGALAAAGLTARDTSPAAPTEAAEPVATGSGAWSNANPS